MRSPSLLSGPKIHKAFFKASDRKMGTTIENMPKFVSTLHTGVKSKFHSHSKVSKISKTCLDCLPKRDPLAKNIHIFYL